MPDPGKEEGAGRQGGGGVKTDLRLACSESEGVDLLHADIKKNAEKIAAQTCLECSLMACSD